MAARTDLFQSPDYYQVDELLSEVQKHIREAVRNYVKRKFLLLLKSMLNGQSFLNRS